jgi:alanine racemase
MSRPTQITIDLAALEHNLNQVKKIAPNSAILAMVKSNAYGHGITRIALALRKADALGVASLEEGLQLREAGVELPIVLMEGLFCSDELSAAQQGQFTLVVHQPEQIKMLKHCSESLPFPVWLKIDTGMHRLGFAPEEVAAVYQELMHCPAVKKPIGLMTHFAESDSDDPLPTQNQINLFQTITQHFVGPRSLANSGGILAWPAAHADWVRPGIILYGASPFGNKVGSDFGLKPVMTFSSELIAIHHIKKGERVGYGGLWTCTEDMPVGVVAMGYGDGYPWHAKSGTPMLVNGQSCPLIGRVAMDMLNVDLRNQPNAKIGDPVLLWGKELPVEKVAAHSNTIAYELLTRITQRVRVVIAS